MKKFKILYGICGLGKGHTFRQLPIVEYFSKISDLMIFAHDNSYDFYTSYFKDSSSVKVVEVAIPFYVGNKYGIDFKASAENPINQKDIFKINCLALDNASQWLGIPDLVISDYESVSAQYAYQNNVPLVTIDQQSKYLCGDFPREINGFTFEDEIKRLHMFFPKVGARIACSFFKVPVRGGADEVSIFPSTLKQDVLKIKRNTSRNSIVVYISGARNFSQTPEQIINIFRKQKDIHFHIFLGDGGLVDYQQLSGLNVSVYKQNDSKFNEVLKECMGIVSTAGHSLISEAMYLGIPVYAIPVAPYEQYMNAHIIDQYGFGILHYNIDKEKLDYFIKNIYKFEEAIKNDSGILTREPGQDKIIKFLEKEFLHP